MKARAQPHRAIRLGAIAAALMLAGPPAARAQTAPSPADSALAREIYEELVEIPSVSGTAETMRAARAMAQHLLDAGFPAEDVHVVGPDTAGMVVAVYRGTGAAPPILLMSHLDVVPARREDWSYDPFTLTEADGWWYGRGTSDNKAGAAIQVADLVRLKRENFTPNRDLILVLTGDEETSSAGIRWAVGEGRALIDEPAFALNSDSGEGVLRGGREVAFTIQAAEKVYLTYRLEVTNPGGHSSIPRPDNAIYQLAQALTRLAAHRFPIHTTAVTRGFFARQAEVEPDPALAAAMRAVGADPPDLEAAEKLAAASPYLNALLRTTCVATRLAAGHADNALPQSARATVNCRVLPGESLDEVDRTVREVLADSAIAITRANQPTPSPPSPPTPEILGSIEGLVEEFWPGVPVVPTMETGATDGLYVRNAGIPVYGAGAIFVDPEDVRAHGKDERMAIDRFYEALEFWYRMIRAFAS